MAERGAPALCLPAAVLGRWLQAGRLWGACCPTCSPPSFLPLTFTRPTPPAGAPPQVCRGQRAAEQPRHLWPLCARVDRLVLGAAHHALPPPGAGRRRPARLAGVCVRWCVGWVWALGRAAAARACPKPVSFLLAPPAPTPTLAPTPTSPPAQARTRWRTWWRTCSTRCRARWGATSASSPTGPCTAPTWSAA